MSFAEDGGARYRHQRSRLPHPDPLTHQASPTCSNPGEKNVYTIREERVKKLISRRRGNRGGAYAGFGRSVARDPVRAAGTSSAGA